jgi:hypothetical protein
MAVIGARLLEPVDELAVEPTDVIRRAEPSYDRDNLVPVGMARRRRFRTRGLVPQHRLADGGRNYDWEEYLLRRNLYKRLSTGESVAAVGVAVRLSVPLVLQRAERGRVLP